MAPIPKPSFVADRRRTLASMSLTAVATCPADGDGNAFIRARPEARARRSGRRDSGEERGAVRGETRVVHLRRHRDEVGAARGDAIDQVPTRLIADVRRHGGATHLALGANARPARL